MRVLHDNETTLWQYGLSRMVILLCRIPSYRNASGLCSDFFLKSIGVTANHRHAVYSCILLFFHQTSNLHSHRVTHLKTLPWNSSVTMFSHYIIPPAFMFSYHFLNAIILCYLRSAQRQQLKQLTAISQWYDRTMQTCSRVTNAELVLVVSMPF